MTPRGTALFGGLLLVALATGAASARRPTEGGDPPGTGPRLEIDATTIDLGSVVPGDPAEARFTLRNAGTEVLRILDLSPG